MFFFFIFCEGFFKLKLNGRALVIMAINVKVQSEQRSIKVASKYHSKIITFHTIQAYRCHLFPMNQQKKK